MKGINTFMLGYSVMSDSLWPHGLPPGFLSFTISQSLLKLVSIESINGAIQQSHPLSFPSPPAFNFSQHQDLFQWVSSSHQVAKILELQIQHQSFQWISRVDFLKGWLVWSLCCPRDSWVFSNTTVWRQQFYRAQPSLWPNSHIRRWLLEKW